jgi:ATP-dependent DNA helicase RecG
LSALSGLAANLLSMTLPTIPRLALGPARMSRRRFWRRFGRLEHERLEFKASANRLAESVVAMAMTAGGTILVGVSDTRRLVGLADVQEALDRVASVANETQVDLDVRWLRVAGAAVLAVSVPVVRPRVVTTPDGRLLRRVGSTNQPLRGEGVLRFLQGCVVSGAPGGASGSRGVEAASC